MLVSKKVLTKVVPNNAKYWANFGYTFNLPTTKYGQVIEVSTDHLKLNSQIEVECWCENCEKFFMQRFCRYDEFCYECRHKAFMKNNSYGTANKGKKLPNRTGELNHRWNPNKSEFKKYAYQVSEFTKRTYKEFKDLINPNNYTRTLCGVEGGYQLDHIVSIKRGFEQGILPEILAEASNLQMLPWKENRAKWHV